MQNCMGVLIPYTWHCKKSGDTALSKTAQGCKLYTVIQIKDENGNILENGKDYSFTSTGITYVTDQSTKKLSFICAIYGR